MVVVARSDPSGVFSQYSEENHPSSRKRLPRRCNLEWVCPHSLLAPVVGPCKERSFRLHPGKAGDPKRFDLPPNGSAKQSHDFLEMDPYRPTSTERQSDSAIVEKCGATHSSSPG